MTAESVQRANLGVVGELWKMHEDYWVREVQAMKVFARSAFVVIAVLAVTAASSSSQTSSSATDQYAVELYKGNIPPPDELLIARMVWELKGKKGTLQEALNDDLRTKLNIYVRGTYRVNDTRFYVFIGGGKELCRVELFKLDNDIWVMEKPEWLLTYFEESLSSIDSTMNGYLTIFSK